MKKHLFNESLENLYLFTRVPCMTLSLLFPVLGLASAADQGGWATPALLMLPPLAFHVFAFVLNDVVDLPLDSTDPLRSRYPLVRGAICPRMALALAQVPLAFGLAYPVVVGFTAYSLLVLAFLLMAAYDLWGKRVSVPFVMDAVQGAGWAALALFGATSRGEPPNALGWVVASYIFFYIMMVNGVHGSLCDAANDSAYGAKTTAILLGARPATGEGIPITRTLGLHLLVLQSALLTLALAPLSLGWVSYGSWLRLGTAATIGLLGLGAIVLLPIIAARRHSRDAMGFYGTLHLETMLLPLPALLAFDMSPAIAVTAGLAYLLPTAAMGARFVLTRPPSLPQRISGSI